MTTTMEPFSALYTQAHSPDEPADQTARGAFDGPPPAPRLSPRDEDVDDVLASAASAFSPAKRAATGAAEAAPAAAPRAATPVTSDPYVVLGLDRLCSDQELKVAYHRMAMRWHPDKHRENAARTAEAESMMRAVNGAYQLLSDASRRFMYDVKNPLAPSRHYAVSPAQFRNRALADQGQRAEDVFHACNDAQGLGYTGPVTPPPPTPPMMRAASVAGPPNGATLLDECPEVDDVASRADARSPRVASAAAAGPRLVRQNTMPQLSKRPRSDEDDLHRVPDLSAAAAAAPVSAKRRAVGQAARPAAAVVVTNAAAAASAATGAPAARAAAGPPSKEFSCSLEELAVGCVKRLKLTKRTVSCLTGQMQVKETVVEIAVVAGWRDGQRIAFCETDNTVTPITGADMEADRAALASANVVFVLRERAHPVFKRDEHDLVMPCKISLQQALLGVRVDLRLLDTTGTRRVVGVRVDGVIAPGKTVSVANEGMPILGTDGQRGNLRVVFDVEFPTTLTEEQRGLVPKLFA